MQAMYVLKLQGYGARNLYTGEAHFAGIPQLHITLMQIVPLLGSTDQLPSDIHATVEFSLIFMLIFDP